VLPGLIAASWGIAFWASREAPHDNWLYYNGGDGTWYYTTAYVLGGGHVPMSQIGYGYSMLTAPIARLAGPNVLVGMPAIVLFNVLVLGTVALLCVYGIAQRLAGHRAAVAVTLAWIASPLLAVWLFIPDYHARYVDVTLPAVSGLTGLGDYPSMVLLLVAACFMLRLLTGGDRLDAVGAGLAAGLAIAVKPANALFLPAPVLALGLARKPRSLLYVAAGVAPSVLGLALWKYRGLGYLPILSHPPQESAAARHPVLLSYSPPLNDGFSLQVRRYLPLDWSWLRFNLSNLGKAVGSGWFLAWGGLAGFLGLARRSLPVAAFTGAWLASYLLAKGSSPELNVVSGNFLPHLLAAVPAYFILVVSVAFLVPVVGRRRPAAPSAPPHASPAVRVGVAVLAAISVGSALVVGVLPVSSSRASTQVQALNLFVPSDQFELTASVKGNAVTLRWPLQRTDGTEATYTIFRDRNEPLNCIPVPHAALSCDFEGTAIVSLPSTQHSFVDTTEPGRWFYRVALAASPTGPQLATDYVMLSREASATAGNAAGEPAPSEPGAAPRARQPSRRPHGSLSRGKKGPRRVPRP
jgi:hypothetical protein